MQNIINKGAILALVSGVLFGTMGYFGTQLMQAGFSITTMLFWRFFVASLIVLTFLVIWRKPFYILQTLKQDTKLTFRILMLGCIFYSLTSLFYFLASQLIGTGLSMVIFFCFPAIVALLMLVYGRDKIKLVTWCSILISILGCILIATKGPLYFDIIGIIFAVLSASCYAIYVFASSNISFEKLDGYVVSFLICLGNSITFLIFAAYTQQFQIPTNHIDLLNIIGFSLFSTVLPIFFLLKGLQLISASKASMLSLFEPVVTLIIGIYLLGEPAVTTSQMLGIGLILSSAIVLQLER